jgi:hypothetical protein
LPARLIPSASADFSLSPLWVFLLARGRAFVHALGLTDNAMCTSVLHAKIVARLRSNGRKLSAQEADAESQ